jgi:hypothetical protein
MENTDTKEKKSFLNLIQRGKDRKQSRARYRGEEFNSIIVKILQRKQRLSLGLLVSPLLIFTLFSQKCLFSPVRWRAGGGSGPGRPEDPLREPPEGAAGADHPEGEGEDAGDERGDGAQGGGAGGARARSRRGEQEPGGAPGKRGSEV